MEAAGPVCIVPYLPELHEHRARTNDDLALPLLLLVSATLTFHFVYLGILVHAMWVAPCMRLWRCSVILVWAPRRHALLLVCVWSKGEKTGQRGERGNEP
jgi:hypothetical protein